MERSGKFLAIGQRGERDSRYRSSPGPMLFQEFADPRDRLGRIVGHVPVAAAAAEVTAAIKELRGKGAKKIFIAGHSQGAVFALHHASGNPPDGLVIIAPGGDVSTNFYRQQVGASVSRARGMVAAGKGTEAADFDESEGGKGSTITMKKWAS